MVFVPPTWIEGLLAMTWYHIGIPIIVALVIGVIVALIIKEDRFAGGFVTFIIIGFIGLLVMFPVGEIMWHENYEVPSVQEKIITIQEIQPAPKANMSNINNADELMFITTEGEGYANTESGWFAGFSKWDTRDIFNQLRINGTYKIKYYGWREGKTSSFPNILEVTEVINETNTTPNKQSDYFGVKLATI